jgi:hypothetical protein
MAILSRRRGSQRHGVCAGRPAGYRVFRPSDSHPAAGIRGRFFLFLAALSSALTIHMAPRRPLLDEFGEPIQD